MSSEKLISAIETMRAGDKTAAMRILAGIVSADPRNELAWFWLSRCVDEPDRRRYCLFKVLALNPNNKTARQELDELGGSSQPAPQQKAPLVPAKNMPSSAFRPSALRSTSKINLLIGGLAFGVICGLCLLTILVAQRLPSLNLPLVSVPEIMVGICNDDNYFKQTTRILDRWNDATKRAGSTSRISLTSVVGEMQQIKRDFENLTHPECANRFHQLVTASMTDEIDAYLMFMQQASDSAVSGRFSLANDWMSQALDEMKRIRGLGTAIPVQPQPARAIDVTVTATEFGYDNQTLLVNTGQKITITLKNGGSVRHTLVIPRFGIKLVADPGKSATGSFVAGDLGTYPFYCEEAGHKEAGMTGQVIIR